MKPILEMRGITKRFPGVIANDNVNLTIYPGEVHALLGENGAGKSTLMNILSGIYSPNDGYIYINGKLSWIDGPKSAIAQGIGMVHQHFKLIEPLTVAENIYLAVGKRCPFLLNKKKMEEEIRRCSEEYHLPVDPSAKINQLSVGEQQRVEIVKQLYCGANILVLDDPTAVLTPQETEQLFATLRKMTEQGKAVVFITHKLFEVMEYSDRITVLRSGKSIGTMLTKETNQDELVRLMVGRSVEKMTREEDAPAVPGGSILELKQVEALGDRKTPVLRGIDLEVKAGEIFGIAGVAGNGQKELCEVIAGLRQVTAGTVMMNGQDVTNCSARQAREKGIAYVPEDRMGTGLVGSMNMKENVILRRYMAPEFSEHGLLKQKEISKKTDEIVEAFDIKNAGTFRPVSLMSGGNLQKLLLAREVSGMPSLIIAAYPVHGVDIGATESIHKVLISEKKRGAGVILISEDLEELYEMADRIGVLYEGKIVGVVSNAEFTYDKVGLMMTGSAEKEESEVH